MAKMLPFLLAFPLLLFQVAPGCLHCDRRFLDTVTTLLVETLPVQVPNRHALIERHIQALSGLHGTFLRKKYERVLDVRGVMSLKSNIISQLREIKKKPWKGVFLWQLSMYHFRTSLRKHMQEALEQFADLACSEDCMTEGPVLDCWSCLRISAQCFDGELCGVEDRHLAEYKEVVLYVFLVCESVLTSSAVLMYLVCVKHKKKMLRKALAH
ncbi:izumo sperm-egg fusion protein 3 isoform X2 [Hemicordylus capensis]|uniref:izumo sperm-egg fusion protein 3 isoform X2 n=1 Tax=Hemicordylus capensis TaxID=884348 RepID=UPI002302585B|nr:izumo sperm-egg fusion protein 3 isoform X2 [Hemicordylus capensis]